MEAQPAPRERSDSTTFGTDPAAAAAFRNANGSSNGDATPNPPPPAAGSGLIGACALVGAILHQVALRDCPPDNEAGARGAVGFGGTAAALSSPRGHGRKSAKTAKAARGGGGGWEQQAAQGFSRQRHVGRSLLQLQQPQPQPVEAAAPPLASGRGGRKSGAITRTPPPPPLSPSVGSSSLGSPLSIEDDGGVAGGIEPMRTWESEGSHEGSLLALIRLQSGDSMDQDQGEDYPDAREEEAEEAASTVPSTRSSTPLTAASSASNNNHVEMGGGGGAIIPPAAATTAPLMANYCNSNGGNGNGARQQTTLRTETRMGTASLAALCARTLDTVAAVGRSSASGAGSDAGEDHDEQPSGGGRGGGGADNGSNEEEYGNGGAESVEQVEEAPAPPPPAPVAATSPSQSPQRRVQLRMFGSEYARHLSSTPFSPPVPRGSKSSGGGRSSSKTSAGGGGSGSGRSPKRKNRLDKFSSSNGGGAGIRAGGDPSLSLLPPTTPGKQLDDASPFSPESPLGLVQTESDVSNLSGLTAQTNPQHVPPVLPRPPPPQPTGTSSLPKEPFAIENQSPDVLTGAITDILVTVGNERPPKGYYRIAQSSSGLDLSTMKRAKAKAGGGSSAAKSSGKSALAQLGRKPVALHLNVKKEASWDRAVQRPCVTAITVIYPDRNE